MQVRINRTGKTGYIIGLSIIVFYSAFLFFCVQPAYGTEGKIIISDD